MSRTSTPPAHEAPPHVETPDDLAAFVAALPQSYEPAVAIASLHPFPGNPKEHDLGAIITSIEKNGMADVVKAQTSTRRILGGHGTVEALTAIKWTRVPVLWIDCDDRTARRLVVAYNRIPQLGGENDEAMAHFLTPLAEAGDLLGSGYDGDDYDALQLDVFGAHELPREPETVPPPPKHPVTRTGDLILLGTHRLLCGDSTNRAHVARLLTGGGEGEFMFVDGAPLLHADPPYGMGKEKDGIANDNLYEHKLDAFQLAWWRAWRPYLAATAAVYVWGNAEGLWRLWYVADTGRPGFAGLGQVEPITFRNEIVWDKKTASAGGVSMMGLADRQLYPNATERCLFFHLGRVATLVNTTKDDYWPGWDAVRLWLVAERDRVGFTAARVKKLCGNNMHGHWFGTSQWCIISREHYATLAEAAEGRAFTRSYDDLYAEYRGLLARFHTEVRTPTQSYFDNTHDLMRDVWEFARVLGEERYGHATPKPVEMMERVARSSCPDGGIVLEPFAGTGPMVLACERTARTCYAMELSPAYCDVIVDRWEAATGQQATRIHADGNAAQPVDPAAPLALTT